MDTNIFSYDSPFGQFMGKLWNLLILNLLCLLCCIPVVTAGASITALYYVTLKMAENRESKVCRSFIKAFKENFFQASILGVSFMALLIILGVWIIFVMSVSFVPALPGPVRFALFLVLMAVLVFVLMTVLYVFAVQARFANPPACTVENACMMAIGHLPATLSMMVIDAVFYYIAAKYATWLVFWLLSGPIYINSLFLCRIFKKYMPSD